MSTVSSTMEANDNRPRQLIVLGCKRLLFAPMEQQRIQTAQGEKAHRHVFSLRCLYDDSKWSLQLLFRLRFLPFTVQHLYHDSSVLPGLLWRNVVLH